MLRNCILLLLLGFIQPAIGQRNYVPNSVLGSGDWYKISLKKEGLYKIDAPLLKALGINITNLPSASIRLFGNGGAMLPEKVSTNIYDDLQENAIDMQDGGDGIFGEGDYFLFYARGPDQWLTDSINKRFAHQQNIYSDKSFYFIKIGGTGRRMLNSPVITTSSVQTDSYDERYYYEPDSLNLLNSGKNWYGAGVSNTPGVTSRRAFSLPLDNLVPAEPATVISNVIGRAIGSGSVFNIKQNGVTLLQHELAGVTASSYDLFATTSKMITSFSPSSPMILEYEFSASAYGAQGWLDWFEVFARRKLVITGGSPLFFRDWKSVGNSVTVEFIISGADAATRVWDISNPLAPVKMNGTLSGSQFRFKNDGSILREYVAFGNSFLNPSAIGRIKNQDLHQAATYNLLIITHPSLLHEANRLAQFHQSHDQLTSLVVTTDQVFNEFASGTPDPVSIRNFVKMFFDRAGSDSTKRPEYLLLFGDGSFDYKNIGKTNSNLVPVFETSTSLDPLSSYTSDDFFGFLDDSDDINDPAILNLLDIGIGRIPAQTPARARAYVDKVIAYKQQATLGNWRNRLTFIADDEDFNLHLQDAETVSTAAAAVNKLFIDQKIYLDAFQQESNASGSRYPEVNRQIRDKVEKGTLILNYNGHGGFRRLAEEVVLDQDILDDWYNPQRLPLFVTATCDFAPYDNPEIFSLGEDMLLGNERGAIALMTTTRLVFAYSNRIMNQQYLEAALTRKPDGTYRSLGQAVQVAKNNTYTSFSDVTNNRKFTLLGDPALTLNFPRYQVNTTAINGKIPGSTADTLSAFEEVNLKGEIVDTKGTLISGFNGTIDVTVFDKPESIPTLANDPSSLKQVFQVQQHLLFQGKATVSGGKFTSRFMIPKDINYQPGNGRISYYAENGIDDANGSFTGFIIAGSAVPPADNIGPVIRGWLDDYGFQNGQTVSENPLLLLKLSDSSGINLTGLENGHEIVGILDGDTKNRFILNDWLQMDRDSYQQGTVSFRLPRLPEGPHELLVKAWDNLNNSSVVRLQFNVKNEKQLIDDIFNYPNPVSGATRFCITHKRPGEKLLVTISIFNIHGQVIKRIERTINTPRVRSCEIEWDGLDTQRRKAGKGLYIYNIEIAYPDGMKANKSKKLIVM